MQPNRHTYLPTITHFFVHIFAPFFDSRLPDPLEHCAPQLDTDSFGNTRTQLLSSSLTYIGIITLQLDSHNFLHKLRSHNVLLPTPSTLDSYSMGLCIHPGRQSSTASISQPSLLLQAIVLLGIGLLMEYHNPLSLSLSPAS